MRRRALEKTLPKQSTLQRAEAKRHSEPVVLCLLAGLFVVMSWALHSTSAFGAEGEIRMNVSTPAIEKLKKDLLKRDVEVKAWKGKGVIGEGADGLLAVRIQDELSLMEKKKAGDLVAAINQTRKSWYREIIKANGKSQKEAEKVMKLAAKIQHQQAQAGDWLQSLEDGTWHKLKK